MCACAATRNPWDSELFIHLVLLIFLNAVPELIYLGHHGGLNLLSESYRFIGENWIEWFPPNMLLILAAVGIVFSIVSIAVAPEATARHRPRSPDRPRESS